MSTVVDGGDPEVLVQVASTGAAKALSASRRLK